MNWWNKENQDMSKRKQYCQYALLSQGNHEPCSEIAVNRHVFATSSFRIFAWLCSKHKSEVDHKFAHSRIANKTTDSKIIDSKIIDSNQEASIND